MLDESRPAPAIDWTVLAPLLVHVVVTHTVVGVVRVTVSYRTIELGLPPAWLGVISAGFALLPIFLALRIGRYIDRGHDAHAAWIGSILMLLASAALWAWPDTGTYLLVFTILLGTGHMFLMASQQMLAVRCANRHGRDDAFGYFMVAVSLGQGLGPYIAGLAGSGVTVPTTGPLFAIGALLAVVCLVISFAIRPAPKREVSGDQPTVSLMALLRRPGMPAVLIASVVTVTASDLLMIYLPLLGAERHIDAGHIGNLLMTRALAALVARIFYARLIRHMGRLPLTLASTFMASGAFVLMAVPSLPVMYAAAVAIGLGLGIASTLTISGIVEVAPPNARATAMTLRITGNRISLVLMPFVGGLIAAATGVAGILLVTAMSLSACAAGMQIGRKES